MWAIHVHYQRLELAVAPRSTARVSVPARSPLVIVPIARLDQPSLDAVAFARSIAPDALAVHITNDAEAAAELRDRWSELGGGAELVIVESPYRALIKPFLRYLDALQRQDPIGGCWSCFRRWCPTLVGQLPAQPDRAAAEAAPLLPAQHDRG